MYGIVGCTPSIPSSAYVASKHAVVGLSKNEGSANAHEGIRVNAICPGYVETPLLLANLSKDFEENEVKGKVPMRRMAKMEEIADAIVWLASPMSSYMTGGSLIVDG
jgi:NAD(P)-dependent dehydrogenase (short-subunit alcohol dehydrogenase family)